MLTTLRGRIAVTAAAAGLILAVMASLAFSEDAQKKAKEPLSLKTTAFVVVVEVKDGKKVEVLKPLPKGIVPGTLVQYNISGTNEGKGELKDIRTDGKVPPNTRYVDKSARCDKGGEIFFSCDNGATWSKPPLKKTVVLPGGEKKTVEVSPDEYTGVRFVVKKLAAGAAFTGTYRVLLQ